eukprot:scaffold71236_cov69-Phaeocystis_antarctica.AAC.2
MSSAPSPTATTARSSPARHRPMRRCSTRGRWSTVITCACGCGGCGGAVVWPCVAVAVPCVAVGGHGALLRNVRAPACA